MVQGRLESLSLLLRDLAEGQRGIDDAVEHHRPDMRGVELGVRESEQAPVGLAHVCEPGVTQGLTESVHVASHVGRADIGQQGRDGVLAIHRKLTQAHDRFLDLGLRGRHEVRGHRRLPFRPITRDRIASFDAAWVEQHDVEIVQQLWGESAEFVGRIVDTGYPGTARIDDERADPGGRILGRVPDKGNGNGRPTRVCVVEGNHERAALEIAHARHPGDGTHGRLCRRRRGCRVVDRAMHRGGLAGPRGNS